MLLQLTLGLAFGFFTGGVPTCLSMTLLALGAG